MSRRTVLLTFRVLEQHQLALRRLAKREGESMSVILRKLIREAAQAKGLWPEFSSNSFQLSKQEKNDEDK